MCLHSIQSLSRAVLCTDACFLQLSCQQPGLPLLDWLSDAAVTHFQLLPSPAPWPCEELILPRVKTPF